MSSLRIRAIQNRSDLKRFIDFPFRLYSANSYWVPSMRRNDLAILSNPQHPVRENCSLKVWVVENQTGQIQGKICGIINHKETEITGAKQARFGWMDFVDDLEVSSLLLQQVEKWAKKEGCGLVKGPFGFSNMDKTAFLIEGFEEPITMATLYNYPYYPVHVEQHGFEKLVDWKEYEATVPTSIPDKVAKFANLMKTRYELHEMSVDKKNYRVLGKKIFHLINDTYQSLDGYIPHTENQIDYYIEQYIKFVDPDYMCLVANRQEELIAVGVSMPSFSKALQKIKGRLFPFGFLSLQKALKKNDRADLYLIAVRDDYKSKGVTAIIFNKIIHTFIGRGIKKVETNPELEHNQQVQNLWKGYEMRQHKKRRCYVKHFS